MELEKVLTLRKPVEFGGTKYEQLQLREPTAGDLERAANAGTSTGILISLISLVAKVPRKVAEGLSQRDFQEATDFFGEISAFSAEPNGETSSPT